MTARESAREGEGEDDGLRVEEQQPFLTFEWEGETNAAALPAGLPIKALRKNCRFTIFGLLFVVTILGLTGVILTFPPRGIWSLAEPAHSLPGPGDEIQSQGHDSQTTLLFYNESVPSIPRLREGSEYILSSSWDYSAPPITRTYRWTISDAALNPDGVYRPMMLINNQYPGPLIECNQDDTIIVEVKNDATNATSLHFHGLFQRGTNNMDGTVGVTQCPIAPNSSFTYQFGVGGQSGTYWYHAHHSGQASDGLLGPVVIHEKDELTLQELDYATDRIIMVQDYYHNTTSELLMDYLQPDKENDEPVPDNPLINGRGVRDCQDFDGWHCDSSNRSRPLFELTAGQRHRLRFINVGVFAEFQIQIDEHPFYITEVDGTDVHPEPFHRLNILPAQRYSIIVETNVTTQAAYWLRARMVSHCFTTKNNRLQQELRGIVRYSSLSPQTSQEEEPKSRDWLETVEVVCRDLNTSALHPVREITPPPADDFIILRANFEVGDWSLARGYFNQSTWRPNTTYPSLHRFLDAPPNLASLDDLVSVNDKVFDKDNDFVLQTRGVQVVDVSINNFDDGAHPFHLHGHKFFIMAQAQSGYPPTAATLDEYMAGHGGFPSNPLRRDTVTIEGYAWAILRVVLDNPGLWAFHCHNMWHAESGMMMQFLVQSETVRQWEIDPRQKAMCGLRGVETGKRPEDDLWVGTFGE